jgi:hypothetical protein
MQPSLNTTFLLFFFFFVVLGFELRVTEFTPPAFFVMGFFKDICPGLALNCNLPDLCLLSS